MAAAGDAPVGAEKAELHGMSSFVISSSHIFLQSAEICGMILGISLTQFPLQGKIFRGSPDASII
jgi:hypothetical protein